MVSFKIKLPGSQWWQLYKAATHLVQHYFVLHRSCFNTASNTATPNCSHQCSIHIPHTLEAEQSHQGLCTLLIDFHNRTRTGLRFTLLNGGAYQRSVVPLETPSLPYKVAPILKAQWDESGFKSPPALCSAQYSIILCSSDTAPPSCSHLRPPKLVFSWVEHMYPVFSDHSSRNSEALLPSLLPAPRSPTFQSTRELILFFSSNPKLW